MPSSDNPHPQSVESVSGNSKAPQACQGCARHRRGNQFTECSSPLKELGFLNDCHTCLHLLTIGDTLDASGQCILPGCTNGTLVCPSHQFCWPPRPTPPPAAWKTWQHYLFQILDICSATQPIKPSLGTCMAWHCSTWTNSGGDELHQETPQGWRMCTRVDSRACRQSQRFHPLPGSIAPPAE